MLYRKNEGFTFIEIMGVLLIISILMGVLMTGFNAYKNNANRTRAKIELKRIATSIEFYKSDIGKYPERLKDLVKAPGDVSGWKRGGYVEGSLKNLEDPWGNKYKYQLTPGKEHPYELYSYASGGKGAPKGEWLSAWSE